MSTRDPKLRGSHGGVSGPWPLGEIPDRVIYGLAKQLVHRMAVGHGDITGDDFGTIFAKAIGGVHRSSPVGIADVVLEGDAWSIKTVKHRTPFSLESVRLISGRCSPDYSLGIENAHKDLNATGKAVLSIWNARVNESFGEHDRLRIAVFVRNMECLEFMLFEADARRFAAGDYTWAKNPRGNLEGTEKGTDQHVFTWQFHGSQLTIIRRVPGSAVKFRLTRRPALIEPRRILSLVKFSKDWVEIQRSS